MGAEEFSKRLLIFDFKDDADVTHLGQVWAQEENSYPVDFGEISGKISDLQACLNLNALRADSTGTGTTAGNGNGNGNTTGTNTTTPPNEQARIALDKLISTLAIDGVGEFEAEAMADALTDWLDKDGYITGTSGAEDDDYASREFAYLAANHYLASISELRLVEHFTPAVIEALKPYICVLPQNSDHEININTITSEQVELLQALLGSTLDEAQQILTARPEDGFEKIEDFHNLPELGELTLKDWQKDQFVIDSEYFNVKISTNFNNSYFFLNSVMQVADDQKIHIISRTIGRN